jgi:hypothetical protein
MNTSPRWLAVAFGALMAVATSSSWAAPLNVKPGLWETTTVTEKRGSNHPTNLDQLTPEQRAKVEHELALRVKKETHTVKSCLREAQIKNAEAFIGGARQHHCTRTPLTQTATDLAANIECKGANPMVGKIEMQAEDAERMTGKSEMTYGAPGKLQLLTISETSARWLGGSCVVAAPAPVRPAASNPHP